MHTSAQHSRRLVVGVISILFAIAIAGCSDHTSGRSSGLDGGADSGGAADLGGVDVGGVTDASGGLTDSSDTPVAADSAGDDVSQSSDADASNDDAEGGDASASSRCTVEDDTIRCTRHTNVFDTGLGDYERREVHWQVPLGESPDDGWPAAILFQGSFYSSEQYWEGAEGALMGLYHRARTVKMLLEAGFAVITPEAQFNGTTYWNSNVAPYATAWTTAPDHQFMLDIFDAIDRGELGEVDAGRLYAGGISSGGYMTSRMAEAYPGKFQALAIMSASYCWCAGSTCYVPASLPDNHPPTLFIHGQLDTVVPVWTMTPYEGGLSDDGVDTRVIIEDTAGHEWVEQAPEAIVEWFEAH
jgi:poly(3-hydroxybutyrate) depolymerase